MARTMRYDGWLFFVVASLCAVGVLMVYSSSSVVAIRLTGNASHFFMRHLLYLGIGIPLFVVGMVTDFRVWGHRRMVLILATITFVLMALALFSPARNGAHRWVGVGAFTFQPVEMAKVLLLLFACAWLARNAGAFNQNWRTGWPVALMGMGLAGLAVLQPDLGSAALLCLCMGIVFFLGGVQLPVLGVMGLAGLGAGAVLVVTEEYRMRRLMSFLDPSADPLGAGFHVQQSLIAIGSGGLWGRWLHGGGGQKFLYLPEPHTDFIFAILGEEAGLIGCLLVVGLFALLLVRGLRAGFACPEPFGRYLALSITFLFVFQALLNILVVLGLFPTKGVPLPFVSYGGSALLMYLFLAGVLTNISRHGADA